MVLHINKVLLVGSGATSIGNENELDAAAFEKLMAFKKMGTKVLYLDDNPFSVVSDEIQPADVFMQPIDLENIVNLIIRQQPDAILFSVAGLKGQALASQLIDSGILEEHQVALLGISVAGLQTVNNNDMLRQTLTQINERVIALRL
ncbi:hypothetical protein [Lentilactobacillus senioris]|uniref:carbamoyl phosphate synthase preATP-grasp domain-containing protein n=1 Tax=Lentilactobacillus senioris TaxID=931534 RepID=UPI000AC2220B|nr:hypothetical protein [Lentilactobacillus senioris]